MGISLSQEQEFFIQKALEGNNILVDACVGSGKTTSIQQLCYRFPASKKVLYLTYNKLLKVDAKSRIKGSNITVTNYHGFAHSLLKQEGISCGITDLIQTFNRVKPILPHYDVLLLDEYQDIDLELSELLKIIKESSPSMQIIAVGDMEQKIYDKTALDIRDFIHGFLGKHICLDFTKCFRLNFVYAERLGRIWSKQIVGENDSCRIREMTLKQVVPFIAGQQPEDILCLGARTGDMTRVLNELESGYPEKFNKKTVYASISENDDGRAVVPKKDSAIFTTYDSSKGLERKICIVFDFDEGYWASRAKKPQQSYEILRNIFCVAASRGKEQIIFVKSKGSLLSEETLSTAFDNQTQLKETSFSEMFDFKYKESVEKCYSQLEINRIPSKDHVAIDIKMSDDLIDLSPCIGMFQEASFFKNYNIDKDIELYFKLHNDTKNLYTDEIVNSPIGNKVLFLTALETKQQRYLNQVKIPFITKNDEEALHNRLAEVFSKNDKSQVHCVKIFDNIPGKKFKAEGFADVVKNNIVYELKFVSELKHEHFLQCACYVIALNLKKGVLWNTRNNEMFEIIVPDEKKFCLEVARTVLKISDGNKRLFDEKSETKEIAALTEKSNVEGYDSILENKANSCFAVVDTETTWTDRVMSIGLCIVEKETYRHIEDKYYIIYPEAKEPGMYSSALTIKKCPTPTKCSRTEALNDIRNVIASYSVTDIFAYNASFDCGHLYEINYVSWFDIMKIAAYKQFNHHIPDHIECCKTGRMKKNYGVETMMRLVSGNNHYAETHNALRDAFDESELMRLLEVPYEVYLQNALVKSASRSIDSLSIQPVANNSYVLDTEDDLSVFDHIEEMDDDETFEIDEDRIIFSEEAAELLRVSKSTVYKLIKNGSISAVKTGKRYHISEKSVLSYIEHKKNVRKALMIFLIIVCVIIFVFFMMGYYRLFFR